MNTVMTRETDSEDPETSSSSAAAWKERRAHLRLKRQQEDGANDFEDSNNLFDPSLLSSLNHRQPHSKVDNSRRQNTASDYVPHLSTAKRLKLEADAIVQQQGKQVSAQEEGSDIHSIQRSDIAKTRKLLSDQASNRHNSNKETSEDENKDQLMDERVNLDADNDPEAEANEVAQTLLEQAAKLRQTLTQEERAKLSRQEEENRILREASKIQTNALQAASERAHGIVYTESLPTSWRCPRHIIAQGEQEWSKIRKNWHILLEGDDCPPPIKTFADMTFPKPILNFLEQRNVRRPTPIQMQGLPVALSGRDLVGIAFTGSGKTITFSLPLVMFALEEEIRMPIIAGEGPVGVILAPSRELVRQTFELVEKLCETISKTQGYPSLRAQLVIGGESAFDQLEIIRQKGVHAVVATPGRLRDFLKRKSMNLDICRYICLDEADRMLDLGFDEEVGEIMNHFRHQRQTLLFSATFPKKFQDFAKKTLVRPIVVNVGRAGAANLDVIQEVEYVKQEAKIVYLLECLQKTAPPVIIFCEKKGDVDDIHEYLLLKGVEAVSIHGAKEQEERNEAIKLFKEGKKDVLIATDIAAKGLDFADIQHVINFDMPTEIENYVHRIGRTGRCGKTGVATTFINKSCTETTLLDLKHLLKEAHQRIPPVLMIMDDPLENEGKDDGTRGCSFCGGLGHTIINCPKIDKDARQVGRKDVLASSGGYGGEW